MAGPVSPREVIERERRWARVATFGAALPIVLFIASLFTRAAVDLPSDPLFPAFFRALDEASGSWVASGVLQGIAMALMAIPLVYLFLAASARSGRVLKPLVGFCVIGPVLVGLQAGLTAMAQVDAASQFVDQSAGVGDIYTLASDLYDDSSLRTLANALGAGGALSLVFAMIYTSLWASRTGLVTRFYGTLGMGLGASLLFPPLLQLALPMLFLWFGYMALIISGRLRKGRPPAWDAGEAVPWPTAGQEPVAAAASAGGEIVEGDASEIPGVDENPNAARRERAKRRKRKRRS